MIDVSTASDISAQGSPTRIDAARIYRFAIISIVVQVLYSGVRFNDGDSLLAFAKDGFGAEIRPGFEYLFDSQLKVIMLYVLDVRSPIGIGILFILVSAIPYIVPFFLDRFDRLAVALLISITPLTKVLAQNVGIGDGVQIATAIMLVYSKSFITLWCTSVVIILWHFQHGVAIVAFVLAMSLASDERFRVRAGYLLGLVTGAALFFVIRASMGRVYVDRLQYIADTWIDNVLASLAFSPIMLLVALPSLFVIWKTYTPSGSRLIWVGAICAACALLLSLVALDRSRGLFILTWPILLYLLKEKQSNCTTLLLLSDRKIFLPLAAFSAAIPLSANYNIDIYVWPQLFEDFERWLH